MLPGSVHNYWWPLVILAVVIVCGLAVARGYDQLSQVRDELQQVQKANQRLEKENQAMYRAVLSLRKDDQAIARICREDLGLARQDEVVYLLPQPAGRPAEQEALAK